MGIGCTGADSYVCAIIPSKKAPNGWLSVSDREQNETISSDREIVANYFRRLCTFDLISSELRWGQSKYNLIFKFAIVLTIEQSIGILYVRVEGIFTKRLRHVSF